MNTPIHIAVRRFLREKRIPEGGTLLAAVSGGADSLTLLYVLAELREEFMYTLRVAHIHHGIRPGADDDVARLQTHCDSLGVMLDVAHVDVPSMAENARLSVEVAGRQARYRYLFQTACMTGAHAICTGHTKDDQAETLLLRIVAGTGIEGLGGIHPARLAEPTECAAPVWLWRPLLDVTRKETASFCADRGFTVLDDPANADLRYPRNRVRHALLPMLERDFNPAIRNALVRLADLAREDEAVLSSVAETVCAFEESEGVARVMADPLLELPLALQRRVVRRMLRAIGGTGKTLGFENIERMLAAVRARQRECHLHGALAVRYSRGWVTLGPIRKP